MSFSEPALLGALLAWAALAAWLLHRAALRDRLAEAFAEQPMLQRLAEGRQRPRTWLKLGLVLAGGALCTLALAGPRWGMKDERVEARGVDVVFAVDLSPSMNARDLAPSRLEAARRELEDLIDRLQGNRLGLVGFAGSAFTFAPLTLDSGAAKLFLEQMTPEAIPIPGSAVGDAVRVALGQFPEDGSAQFIVLLTDGEDHHSEPLEAARQAAERGVRLFALGIGSEEGELVPEVAPDGRERGVLRDRRGELVRSRLDSKTLEEMAKITGGRYFRVTSAGQAAREVARALAQEEGRTLQSRMERRYHERFQLFLALGLALILAGRLLPDSPPHRGGRGGHSPPHRGGRGGPTQ